MFYAVFGEGDPILLVHGGLASANVWEAQVAALSPGTKSSLPTAGVMGDRRGTGRHLHYRDMADDYVALLDQLGIQMAALVGWSDGAIIGLDIAIRYPDRLSKLFAHAANWNPAGLSLLAGGLEPICPVGPTKLSAALAERWGQKGRDDMTA